MKLFECNMSPRTTLSEKVSGEEKKLTKIFIFMPVGGASKGFMKALKAFIKPFKAPQLWK